MDAATIQKAKSPIRSGGIAENGVITIARLTFREAISRRIVLVALVMGLLFLIVYGIGFHYVRADILRTSHNISKIQLNGISNFLMMAGLYVINFLTIAMAVLTSVDTISGEIASGTIHTLVSKPIWRWEIVAGKWLGFSVMLLVYVLLMAGGVLALVRVIGQYTPPHPVLGVALLWLNAVLMMSVSLLGGTYLSTLANGVLVFGLYGIAFVGGWIEQIGSILQGSVRLTTTNIGIITSLLIPSEAVWKRVAYEMQSPLVTSLGATPFTARSTPSDAMMIYALIYLVVVTLLAIRQFSKRDL
jgi:ABC-type transport system involved in multi-copper enzyme maturation permease subunit